MVHLSRWTKERMKIWASLNTEPSSYWVSELCRLWTFPGDIGCSDQRKLFVQNDVDRNLGEEVGELLFVFHGCCEAAILQLGENFNRDSSGDVNSAARDVAESQVPCFGAVDFDPQIQCCHAHGTLTRKAAACDLGRGIHGMIVKTGMAHGRVQELVHAKKTSTG